MTTVATFTPTRRALRGRAMGVFAGTFFGALWAYMATSAWAPPRVDAAYAAIGVVTALLLWAACRMFGDSRRLANPVATGLDLAAQRRRSRWFLAIFAIEIVAINIAAHGLAVEHATQYLMPVAAIVVGLHFYPLGWLFRVRRYHLTATVMTLAGLAGVVCLANGSLANHVNAVVDTICALTLWITALSSSRPAWAPTLQAIRPAVDAIG